MEFDASFTCDCSGLIYTGENCDAEVSGGGDQAAAVASVLGVLFLLVCVAGVAARYLQMRKAMASVQPVE